MPVDDPADHRVPLIKSYQDLQVWQKRMDLAAAVHRLARELPPEETYRLRAQLTRAIASVPANVAEGHSRAGKREFAHQVSIARGSLSEAETFVLLGLRLGYFTQAQSDLILNQSAEVGRMLTALHLRLAPISTPAR
ncbi:MAG TPA: four helix bundle protein [Dehalococcoidia bacterium]|nr:four helix bundle protein [Dehalococcoidia bacterium]